MDQAPALVSLVVASLVVMGSPGPSTMSVTAVGAAFGFRRSLAYATGLVLGTIAILLAVAAGVVALLLTMPRLAPVLVIASAVYIVWLAFKIATAPPLSALDPATRAPSLAGGLLLGVANPKAWFAITAVFAAAATLAVPLKLAVLTAMIVIIHLAWLVAGVALARMLRHPVLARVVNFAFAAILIATAAMAVV